MTRAPVDTTATIPDIWPSITVRLTPFTPAASGRAKQWLSVPYDVEEFRIRRLRLRINGALREPTLRTDYAIGDL